jgi:hypothetical protein
MVFVISTWTSRVSWGPASTRTSRNRRAEASFSISLDVLFLLVNWLGSLFPCNEGVILDCRVLCREILVKSLPESYQRSSQNGH